MTKYKANKILIADVARLTSYERLLLIRELEGAFTPVKLGKRAFYRALKAVSASAGVEGMAKTPLVLDVKLVRMVNTCGDRRKRERLQYMFDCMARHEEVHLPLQGVYFEEPGTPGILNLKDLIPGLDAHRLDKSVLDAITQRREVALKEYFKKLGHLRRSNPILSNQSNHDKLMRMMTVANDANRALMSIDLEAYEHDNDFITEIGISIYDPSIEAASPIPSFKSIHILIEDHIHMRNGTYVADNKQSFLCGQSVILSESEAVDLVQCLLDYYFVHRLRSNGGGGGECALVGHDIPGDVQWLKRMGVEFPQNVTTLDTQVLFGLTNGIKMGLGAILRRLEIPHSHLHNAGNDAYFTLLLLLKLCDPQTRLEYGVDKPLPPLNPQRSTNHRRLTAVQSRVGQSTHETLPPQRHWNYAAALRGIF